MRFEVAGDRLLRGGEPFVALGVDYHPSSAGCRIWADWDRGALSRDFGRIADSGLNTVRLFLFWRDFQPNQDGLDPVVLGRLDQALHDADKTGLACVLSLFTIWMNGQLLDLPWRHGRSLWRDDAMRRAELEYARQVARTGARHGCVLGYDLGDELWNVAPAEAATLSATEVAGWQAGLAAAIREQAPGALVLQANETSAVFGGGPYGVDNTTGLDLIGIHGFPTWSPGSIESTRGYKATNLVAFLTRVARAYRPAIVDELGAYGVDETTAAEYLGAAAVSALAHGASGLLAWCWQDITNTAAPYDERPMERFGGLHRLDGTPKPAMDRLMEVVRQHHTLPQAAGRAPTALYLPERVRGRGAGYLAGTGSALATFYAYLLLTRAHLPFDVTARDLAGRALVLCPCPAALTGTDLERLGAAARAGATVYLSLGDHLHAFPGADLIGAEPVDFDATGGGAGRSVLRWDGDEWPTDWSAAGGPSVTIRVTTGTVLGRYPDGAPALVENRVGAGRVLFAALPFERQLDRPGRLTGTSGGAPATAWEGFYRRLATHGGVRPPISCDMPDVEVVSAAGGHGPVVLVNHADHDVVALLRGPHTGRPLRVPLPAKGWRLVDLGRDAPGGAPQEPSIGGDTGAGVC